MYSTVMPALAFSNALRPSSMFCFSSAEPQAILVSFTGWPDVAGAAAAGFGASVGLAAGAGAVVRAAGAVVGAGAVVAAGAAAGFVGSGAAGFGGSVGLAGAAVGAAGAPQAAIKTPRPAAPSIQRRPNRRSRSDIRSLLNSEQEKPFPAPRR